MAASSSSSRGVFLSYAREDTEAARRIADALRGFGVDVWLDQSELRGGDAWDAKIRRQIRECTLFIALISANSQARGEGYFRREWKLATERTHDMAAGIPFLLPVVVDATPEAGALVPEEFMRVQWTRMPDGLPTIPFVEQVNRLLQAPLAPVGDAVPPRAPIGTPFAPPRKAAVPSWVWGLLGGVVVAGGVAFILSRRPAPVVAPPAVAAVAPTPSPTPLKAIDQKSIAVLPFANMSDDKANTYFTEGIQEDILTNLALAHELHVVSRTSVLQYKDTTKPIRQIAAELGVAYVLEGSVRRAGNKVRVTGQLIHAETDNHVWAKAYDRDLTDIFAIQTELSQEIVKELQAALSPEEKALLARWPTENAAAYDYYLKARRLSIASYAAGEKRQLLEKAVAADPGFARAWGDLADSYAYQVFDFAGGKEENLAKAKTAIERAMQISPDDPEVQQSIGTYYYYGFRDFARAGEIYQKILAQRPNDAGAYNSLGLIQRRQGQWKEALANFRHATELDVADPTYLQNLISILSQARRYEEIVPLWNKLATLQPEEAIDYGFQAAVTSFLATGSRKEAEAYLAGLNPAAAQSPMGQQVRASWAGLISDLPVLRQVFATAIHSPRNGLAPWEETVEWAEFLWRDGHPQEAAEKLGTTLNDIQAKIAQEPENPRLLYMHAMAEMVLGHPEAARADVKQFLELMPESRDAVDGGVYLAFAAQVLDDLGDTDQALAAASRALRSPGGAQVLNVHVMRADPLIRLRKDPRFQALLADPKNNAPLF